MDNGEVERTGLTLCTHSFSLSDVERLRDILIKMYNIKVTINVAGYSKIGIAQYKLRISQKSMERLNKLIVPHMCPSMLYKINYKNREM